MATRHAYDSDSSEEDTPVRAPPAAAGATRVRVSPTRPEDEAGVDVHDLALSPWPRAGAGRAARPAAGLAGHTELGAETAAEYEGMGLGLGSDPLTTTASLRTSSSGPARRDGLFDARGQTTMSPSPGADGLGPSPAEIIAALGQEGGLAPSSSGQERGRAPVPPVGGAALVRVRAAWQSERAAPELRIWEGDAVAAVEAMIEEQSEILNTLAADDDTTEEEHLRLSLVALDMERAKWLLKAYLQIRLGKVEQYSTYIQATPREMLKLSSAERAYLRGFESLRTNTLRLTVLDHLPPDWAGMNDQVTLDAWTTDMGKSSLLLASTFVFFVLFFFFFLFFGEAANH